MRIKILLIFVLGFCFCSPSENIPNIQTGYISVRGGEVFYKTFGKGEPILIVHGGPGFDHSYFLPQMANLAKDYQLIFYDQRASGNSSPGIDSAAFSVDGFVDDIEMLRQSFGIEKLNLMGHSWGGLLAMLYSMTYPENINTLLLINSISAKSSINKQVELELATRETRNDSIEKQQLISSADFQSNSPDAYEKLFKLGFRTQFAERNFIDSLNLNLPENFFDNFNWLQLLLVQFSEWDVSEHLYLIDSPTLLVYGDYDPLSGKAAAHLDSLLPKSKLMIIKDAGHFPFIEKPDDFRRIINGFLNAL